MIYSLTDKLEFAEKPQLEIKGKKVTVNNDAVAVLQIMSMLKNDSTDVLAAADLMFNEKDRKIIDSFHLTVNDYAKVIRAALALATGTDPDEALKDDEEKE